MGIKFVAFKRNKTIMKRITLLLLLCIPFLGTAQGKLEKAKESLKKQPKSEQSGGKNVRTVSKNPTSSRTIYTSPFSSLFFEIGFYATVGTVFGNAEERDLNPYPYFYDNEGEYAAQLSETGRKSSVKIGANYLLNNIKSIETYGTYKPIPIIGIDASYLRFSENTLLTKNYLDVVSLMANYHRFRQKNFTFWWGMGATYVGNEVNTFGFAYTFGTEIYPVKPISLHISWKQSFINQSEIDIFKTQLKYHKKNKAFYLGYNHYNLGSEVLKAPVIGFEITF